MPSTHLSLHYHLVFSTKNREPWLAPTARKRVHKYIGGILRNMNGVAHAVGGTGDHIHIAAILRATHCLADVMREIKSESSGWIHEELRLAGSRGRKATARSPLQPQTWRRCARMY
ncbi:transposase [Prosthecobacter sp.]|uniref:transposase n=1 Tax=Prosthecobacter sp. TaxID=1965333 RepID=UPI0024873503|nr:transposase [Prosthecobacter sp.]MDI1311330.1 transposase [Prosthecobacter sp.]